MLQKYKHQSNLNNREFLKRFTLDIETFNIQDDHKLKMCFGGKTILIGLYDGKEYLQFNKFKDCIEYIFSKSEKSIIYTHNAGKFDYLYYLNECINDYSLEKMIVINGGIIFTVTKGKQKILLRDSYKILPTSLKRLCKSFTPQYSKIEMDYDLTYYKPEIEEYLKYDCISLFEIINIFESEIKNILKEDDFTVDSFYTIASMSFRILIKNYLKGITKNHMSKNLERFVRNSYFGGRVEIYRHYGTNLNYYDVNSLYPFVMHNYEYPIGRYFKELQHEKIRKYIEDDLLGFVKCRIHYPNNFYCLLPVRLETKELIFPYGTFIGTYTTPEIKQALKEGAMIEYYKGIFWNNKDYILRPFIEDFYKLKQESKGAKREIAKLILNSSYGKFGQKRKKTIIITEKEALRKLEHIVDYEVLARGKFYSTQTESYRNRNINPVYASFVTAYARLELFKHLNLNKCFYCDTDSIICSNKMEDKYIDSKKLGLFKREVDNILEGIFISPKLYAIKIEDNINHFNNEELDYLIKEKNGHIEGSNIIYESIKAKGVDGSVISGLNFKKMMDLSVSKNFSYNKNRMVGFMQKFARLDYKNNSSFVNFESRPKKLNCLYDKRKRVGNTTYPINIKTYQENLHPDHSPFLLYRSRI